MLHRVDHPLASLASSTPDEPAKNATEHRTFGVERAATGYVRTMREIHDAEDAALRGEVRQSAALVGARPLLVVVGLVVGLAL